MALDLDQDLAVLNFDWVERELAFRVMAFPDPKFRASMSEVAERIGFPAEVPAHV